jgi:hypothetical protein
MNEVLKFLRPHPHRGDLIAAGAVPLAVAAVAIELRMTQWGVGARFVVVALISGLLLTMALLARLERETPRAYHSVLLVAGLLPLIVALQLLAEVLGAHRAPGAGAEVWTFGAEAGIAAAAARRANSAICTLLAALSAGVAVEAFVVFAFHPHGLGAFRAFAVVLSFAFAAGSVVLRERRRRHAAQLANAAGVATLVLAVSFLIETALVSALRVTGGAALGAQPQAPFGWKLYVLLMGFGLVAYGSVDYEPGPAYLGALVLVTFALLIGLPGTGHGSLLGWPLFLLVLGGVGLVLGLRPRRELPPQPGPATRAETVSLRDLETDDRP